ncbi:hypothetical protein M409DRAFT_60943 [Zasmidium cellare ATCC 36951]|uniref:Uncharacterized protein n=1 Tax=Zasmidium cellare ATCC 36951 TaxID=1080233 RepID=A0A6A6BWM5_ZASCE|nr:uncharacterized protein M409DRAFT_60943 [Zasmidium cellare ATCC 36951]KAF2159234.1 hypothetical protein M409DRAFT_60943 [Zasmidium cellare ATCC 36951]
MTASVEDSRAVLSRVIPALIHLSEDDYSQPRVRQLAELRARDGRSEEQHRVNNCTIGIFDSIGLSSRLTYDRPCHRSGTLSIIDSRVSALSKGPSWSSTRRHTVGRVAQPSGLVSAALKKAWHKEAGLNAKSLQDFEAYICSSDFSASSVPPRVSKMRSLRRSRGLLNVCGLTPDRTGTTGF